MLTKFSVAFCACVYLIVHVTHTEGYAKTEPTKEQTQDHTSYPSQSTWRLFDVGEPMVPTVMAFDDHGAHGPFVLRVLRQGLTNHDSCRLWGYRDDLGYWHLKVLLIGVH